MRLTLHWLLAYLHDVLSPTDSEAMERKIQDSDLASGLIQRIETIERKLRMNAPKVDAKGLAADANNVSEYLDSTLPADRVSDFERICLDSDMHLAEVASCHRVLAMILGKPAEISDELRQRMYAVGQVANIVKKSLGQNGKQEKGALQRGADEPTLAAAASAMTSPLDGTSVDIAPGDDAVVPAMKPGGVPDYLKTQSQGSAWPAIMGIAIGLLLLVGLLRAFGPFGPEHPLLGTLLGGKPNKTSIAAQGESAADEKASSEKEKADEEKSTKEGGEESLKTTPEKEDSSKEPEASKTPDDTAEMPADTGEKSDPASAEKEPASEPTKPATTTKEPATTTDEVPVEPAPASPKKPSTPAKGSEPVLVARYISESQALARFSAEKQQWLKVAPRDLLAAGSRFATLPGFRPQLTLTTGCNVTFFGESRFQIAAAEETNLPTVQVQHGRFQVVTHGAKEGQLDVDLAGLRGHINISDPGATLAIEVKPVLTPGIRFTPTAKPIATTPTEETPSDSAAASDAPLPDPTVPLFAIELSAIGGRVSWTPEGSVAIDIQPGNAVNYLGGEGGEQTGPFLAPDWVDSKSASMLFDLETALQLESKLQDDRSLQISLEELHNDRRVEIRALAALSLASIGHYDHLIKEFADPRQYSYWPSEVDALRRALATGGKERAAVLALMHDMGPSRGGDLLQLLEGYSPQQLAAGSGKILVESLESAELDIRMLAFENLRRITGATFQYRPEKKMDQNKKPVARWREKLKEGGIVYAIEPTPLPPRKPAGK